MNPFAPALAALIASGTPAPVTPPSLETVRSTMGIPSTSLDLRGQRDAVGFASRADQMAKVWELSATPPAPAALGPAPAPGVAAVIAPHDDYLYAGRVYRAVTPLVTAKTVVLVGVFHGYRKFGLHDRLVFDPYRAWRTPDGPTPISPLRDEVLAALPKDDVVQDAAAHDQEHSVEAIAYWLRHARPDVELVPIIVPAAKLDRLAALADRLGGALDAAMRKRGWKLGRDVAIVISTDAVHYGEDFKHVPFGAGGVDAYVKAVARDEGLVRGLAGPLGPAKIRALYETFVDPADPDAYRVTWCGRFSVPLGLLLVDRLARDAGGAIGHPIAYATSVGQPELPVRDVGLGETAPANLYHFVGYPAVAFTVGAGR